MKTILSLLQVLIYFSTVTALHSAAPLTLRVQTTNQPTNSVRFDWDSQSGTSYQILSTTNIDPFSLWSAASGTIAATGTNTAAVGPATNGKAFYKLHTLGQAGSGKPTVSIVSHTNGETVSGLVRIAAAPQDDSRVAFVSLLIDGTEYEPTLTQGDVYWPVNTGHFSNGVHTIQARVVDNAGNPFIGGSAGSAVGGNESLSAVVSLNFTNVVRWVEPVGSFDTFVPVSIRSDIFPTNWTIYVENESGTVIRTFTGFTSNGIVETEWDGNDNNGVPAPVRHAYRVLFVIGELPPPELALGPGPSPGPIPGPTASSMQSSQSSPQLVSYDQYASPVYEVTTALPPIPAIYFDDQVQEEIKQGKHPPLPPLLEGIFSEDAKNPTFKKRRMSLLEASSFSKSQSSGAQNLAAAGLDADTATNDVIVWREAPWVAGKIVLARQVFKGGLTVQVLNTKYANNLSALRTDISTARDDDPRLGARGVHSGSPLAVDVAADYAALLDDLRPTAANVTEFYYIGHSQGLSIGFSEGSPNNGITWEDLVLALGNFTQRASPKWGGRWLVAFNTPYRFVFIDGCLSVTGPLPQAFGILADNKHTRLGKKRRAFLGWTTTTKNSLINQTQADWSGVFWQRWVDANAGNYDRALSVAIAQASLVKAIPEDPLVKGYALLTWAMDSP